MESESDLFRQYMNFDWIIKFKTVQPGIKNLFKLKN